MLGSGQSAHPCTTVARLGSAGTTAGLDAVLGRLQGDRELRRGQSRESWLGLVSTVFGDRQKAKFSRLVEVLT